MRAAAGVLALGLLPALGGAGCFSSWVAVQITGDQRFLEEGEREVAVPLPDVEEQLAVHLPLTIELAPAGAGSSAERARLPFAIGCEPTQRARDRVYRSAFRYGRTWKKTTALMFVLEAAAGAASFFIGRDDPRYALAAGALGVDALGTAALFFVPRKEIYRIEERPVKSRVREDCPDGIALDVGGEVYPVDAAGRIGELGAAALDGWMQAPGAPLRVTYAGRAASLSIGRPEQCSWNRTHHPEATEQLASCPPVGPETPLAVSAQIDVPMGTLTRIEPAAAP